MTQLAEVKVPDLGDFEDVPISDVHVSVGDRVEAEDSLVTLESDKATMDVPAPSAGTIREIKVKVGDRVSSDHVIALLEAAAAAAAGIETGIESSPEHPPAPTPSEPVSTVSSQAASVSERAATAGPTLPASEAVPSAATAPVSPAPAQARTSATGNGEVHASPAVRRFARQFEIDLERVTPTGRRGRVTLEDVELVVKRQIEQARRGGLGLPEMPEVDFAEFGAIERKPLSRIKRISGPSLQRSWLHVPHVTQHDEADITDLEQFRQQNKQAAKEQGFNLTPLAFIMKACVATLKAYPEVNSSLDRDGQHLVYKQYFHFGVAVDTPDGLVVPVVRDVDGKSIMDIARELAETSAAAREGKLRLDQIRGASFTISSLGGIGGTAFTPIVNAPEVAILGVSRAVHKPVYRDGEFAPRLMLPLALSYDHRVIDGALAARVTTHLCAMLSDIRRILMLG